MSHWQHLIICPHRQHHSTDGTQLHCNQANQRHNKHYGKGQTTPQLFGNNPNATMRFKASDMIMIVHSDALYLSKANTGSTACRIFFMGWDTKDGDPIKLKGAFFTLCAILCFVIASTAGAKLGALFLNCKEGMNFQKTLEELGHPQPKTIVHCNNATTVGIANNTVKRQRSQSMEIRYF